MPDGNTCYKEKKIKVNLKEIKSQKPGVGELRRILFYLGFSETDSLITYILKKI